MPVDAQTAPANPDFTPPVVRPQDSKDAGNEEPDDLMGLFMISSPRGRRLARKLEYAAAAVEGTYTGAIASTSPSKNTGSLWDSILSPWKRRLSK